MKPTVVLRIAAILILANAIGHTIGLVTRKNTSNKEMQEVIHQMESHSFTIGGSFRTMDEAYTGNSAIVSVTLFILAALLWVLGSAAPKSPAPFLPILLLLAIAFAANTVISIRYFFVVPTLLQAGAALLVAVAIFQLRSQARSQS